MIALINHVDTIPANHPLPEVSEMSQGASKRCMQNMVTSPAKKPGYTLDTSGPWLVNLESLLS